MERNQLFSLCWKDVASKQNQIFNDLWQKGEQLDVTVICGLKTFYAHRIVLSASSTYFRQTLKDVSTNGNAVLLLPTIDPEIFAGLLQFIYSGEVSVEESQLKTFLDTANTLKIGGIHSESHSNGLTEESLLKTTDNASISILNDTDREWESNEHSPFVDQSRASASPCNIKCEVVDDMVTESDEHTQMYDCESDSMTYQPAEYPKSASGSFEDSLVFSKLQKCGSREPVGLDCHNARDDSSWKDNLSESDSVGDTIKLGSSSNVDNYLCRPTSTPSNGYQKSGVKRGRYKQSWHSMEQAIVAVRTGLMGVLKASQIYGVPRTTLHRRVAFLLDGK